MNNIHDIMKDLEYIGKRKEPSSKNKILSYHFENYVIDVIVDDENHFIGIEAITASASFIKFNELKRKSSTLIDYSKIYSEEREEDQIY